MANTVSFHRVLATSPEKIYRAFLEAYRDATAQQDPRYSPTPVPSLGSSVRAVETGFRTGYAVLADGGVWSFGANFSCALGDGGEHCDSYASDRIMIKHSEDYKAQHADRLTGATQ